MPNTDSLVIRLEKARLEKARLEKERQLKTKQLEQLQSELSVPIEQITAGYVEDRVLGEFYDKDPIAKDVASGKDSYDATFRSIQEMYGTWWRRFMPPTSSPSFDQEVIRVLGSMKNVGVAPVTDIDPELFTTKGRARDVYYAHGVSLVGGLTLSLLALGTVYAAYGKPENFQEINAFARAVPLITAVGTYTLVTTAVTSYMTEYLRSLEKAAIKTNQFLREHYAQTTRPSI